MEKVEVSDFITLDREMDRSTMQVGRATELFTNSIQMCIKCCRKLDKEGKALRKTVKAAIQDGYGDAVELEKVDCFSLCPRGGQVLSTTGARHSRRLVIVQPDSDVAMAVEYLLRGSD